jgi:hypothetical protein
MFTFSSLLFLQELKFLIINELQHLMGQKSITIQLYYDP